MLQPFVPVRCNKATSLIFAIIQLNSFFCNETVYFQMITKTKKIFVGGLSATSTVDDMKQYFEQFGKVR